MNRRGVAILLVLVVLVVAVTAAANVARVSVTGMTTHRIAGHTRLADDLLLQVEVAAQSWLGTASGAVVLSLDSDRPSLIILQDLVPLGDETCAVTVTAVDLLGMPGMQDLRELSSNLPSDVIESVDRFDGTQPGIGPDMIDREQLERSVYPRVIEGDPAAFGGVVMDGPREMNSTDLSDSAPSLCELVAFVGPTPSRRLARTDNQTDPIVLNVNTAPISLLEAALSRSGLDAIDGIMEARSEGEPAVLSITIGDERPVRFVTRSTLWGFRCDVRTGTVHKSQWVVFEQAGGAWRLVRRIVINA